MTLISGRKEIAPLLAACAVLGASPSDALKRGSGAQKPNALDAKTAAIYALRFAAGIPIRQVARLFGLRSHSQAVWHYQRALSRRSEDATFADALVAAVYAARRLGRYRPRKRGPKPKSGI